MPQYRVVHGSLKMAGGVPSKDNKPAVPPQILHGDKNAPGEGDTVELAEEQAKELGDAVELVGAKHAAKPAEKKAAVHEPEPSAFNPGPHKVK